MTGESGGRHVGLQPWAQQAANPRRPSFAQWVYFVCSMLLLVSLGTPAVMAGNHQPATSAPLPETDGPAPRATPVGHPGVECAACKTEEWQCWVCWFKHVVAARQTGETNDAVPSQASVKPAGHRMRR